MSLKSSLITYLRAQAAISDIAGQRVRLQYAESSDRGTAYITVTQVSGDHKQYMTAATGKVIGRIQIDCYETSPIKAEALADAVRGELDGYRGTMGDVFISMCHLDDARDSETPPIEGSARGVYAVQLDFKIGWTVSIPTFA